MSTTVEEDLSSHPCAHIGCLTTAYKDSRRASNASGHRRYLCSHAHTTPQNTNTKKLILKIFFNVLHIKIRRSASGSVSTFLLWCGFHCLPFRYVCVLLRFFKFSWHLILMSFYSYRRNFWPLKIISNHNKKNVLGRAHVIQVNGEHQYCRYCFFFPVFASWSVFLSRIVPLSLMRNVFCCYGILKCMAPPARRRNCQHQSPPFRFPPGLDGIEIQCLVELYLIR